VSRSVKDLLPSDSGSSSPKHIRRTESSETHMRETQTSKIQPESFKCFIFGGTMTSFVIFKNSEGGCEQDGEDRLRVSK